MVAVETSVAAGDEDSADTVLPHAVGWAAVVDAWSAAADSNEVVTDAAPVEALALVVENSELEIVDIAGLPYTDTDPSSGSGKNRIADSAALIGLDLSELVVELGTVHFVIEVAVSAGSQSGLDVEDKIAAAPEMAIETNTEESAKFIDVIDENKWGRVPPPKSFDRRLRAEMHAHSGPIF